MLQPGLALVKEPTTCRYDNFCMRAGDETPKVLPALEVDLEKGNAWTHGQCPEAVNRLLDRLEELASTTKPGAIVGKFGVELLGDLWPEHLDDPDFNPRGYLSPSGELRLCARTVVEAQNLFTAMMVLAKIGALACRDHRRWQRWAIPANAPHSLVLKYNQQHVERIVLKIAYGVAVAWLRGNGRNACLPTSIGLFVRGLRELDQGVTIARIMIEEDTNNTLAEIKVGLVSLVAPQSAVVGLFGDWYQISVPEHCSFGVSEAVGAVCRVEPPRSQRWITASKVTEVLNIVGSTDY